MLTAFAVAVGSVAALASPVFAGSQRGRERATSSRPQRLLVLSLPAITWADLEVVSTPNLSWLLDGAAVADLNTRTASGLARLGDGYATLGAGTRSATDSMTDGDAFEATEPFGGSTAAEAFGARTGRTVRRGLVDLDLASLVEKNAGLLFDAKIGALGDALAKAGFDRAVIANADGTKPYRPPLPPYRRDAVLGLMGSDGTVPDGAVGAEVLQSDPVAPFGVRLSADVVDREFRAVWQPRSVVMVEASDLARADGYKVFASSTQWSRLRRQALSWTDSMVGRLLASVDLRRDAVVVVGPSHPANASALTIAAVKAPGVEPGLLRSPTTRRAGFASLVDVGPTILDVLHVSRPSSMEGRPLAVETRGGSAAHRRSTLINGNRDALFRDDLVHSATDVYIAIAMLLAGAMVVGGGVTALRPWLRRAALASIGYLIATSLAALLHFDRRGGDIAFWCFVIAAATGIAALCELAGRRSVLDPLILALGGLVLLHVADSFAGARAEFNSVFGNSATVGIRFAGLGNLSFAQVAAGAIVAAGLLAWRIGGARGARTSIAILAVSLLALAPPVWGQNFGATLAAAPAFVLLGWLLLGRSVRMPTVIALAGVLIGIGALVGLIDLLRPGRQQTHVGRFFETFGGGGSASTFTVIERKASETFGSLRQTHWILLIATVAALAVYLYVRNGAPLRHATGRVPTLVPTGIALIVVAGLGFALNDTGIPIPGMMAGTAAATIVYLSATFLDDTDKTSTRHTQAREPDMWLSTDGDDRVGRRDPRSSNSDLWAGR